MEIIKDEGGICERAVKQKAVRGIKNGRAAKITAKRADERPNEMAKRKKGWLLVENVDEGYNDNGGIVPGHRVSVGYDPEKRMLILWAWTPTNANYYINLSIDTRTHC